MADIYGTPNDDVLNGTSGDDYIFGDAGNDQISGGDGYNQLIGGLGNDVIQGGSGGEFLWGQEGADQLYGGDGDDLLHIDGNDTVVDGGAGIDIVVVDSGTVTMDLQVANIERANGSYGNDVFFTNGATAIDVRGGDGNDQLIGGGGNDHLLGEGGDDTVIGGAGNDNLYGDNNWHGAPGGDDVIDGGTGADTMSGGTGNDIFVVDDAGDLVFESQGDGVDTIQSSISYALATESYKEVENLTLTGTVAINAIGNQLNNALTGNSAGNTLMGDAGQDSLEGRAGNDQLIGGAGSDTYVFHIGDGADTIQDTALIGEENRIRFGQGITAQSLSFVDEGGALRIDIGANGDSIRLLNFNGASQTVAQTVEFSDGSTANLLDLMNNSGNRNLITGSPLHDYLYGTSQRDEIHGLGGNDQLYGLEGDDLLLGGTGNDYLQGDAGNDVLNGGAGNDVLQDYAGSDTYVFGVGSGVDTVQDWGWDVTDVDTVLVTGGVTPESLLVTQDWATNPGGLTLRLAQSDDQLVIQNFNVIERIQFADGTVWDAATIQARTQYVQTGTAGNDYFGGSFQGDYLQGLGGNDQLWGGDGHDALLGGAGNDYLQGDAGNDLLNGGVGNDSLQDWAGSDTYVFGVGSGVDTLQDWGWDVVDVDTVLVTGGVTPESLLVTQDWATNPGGLTLRLAQSDDQLVIQNFNAIERIQFADGTVWDQAAIQARTQYVQTGTEGNDYLGGGFQGDYLQGLGGDDQLWGGDGDDALLGGTGNDYLYGNAGNDMLNGGSGTDQLYGDMGSDTYVFGVGSGVDTVQDWGWDVADVDTVLVGPGVTPNGLFVTQDWATNPGGLTLRLAQSDDQLVIQNFNAIERIQFADGTVWDQAAIQARTQYAQTGTEGNDYLGGGFQGDYLQGLGGDDQLWGGDGHDALLGGDGNDQLFGGLGDDVLNGGSGNDQLVDDSGSDTYVFDVGSGIDTVQDWGWDVADVDTVLVGPGVTPATLFVTQEWATNPGGLTLRLGQGDDQLQIQGSNSIERIQFADGTVWDQAAIQLRLQQSLTGSAGDDFLWGNAESNYMQGLGGNDSLTGNDGNDILLGGAGDDFLNGGLGDDVYDGGAGTDYMNDFQGGSDTYRWGVGSGQDSVGDLGWVPGEIDTVEVQGATPAEVTLTRELATNPMALTLHIAGTSDTLTLNQWFLVDGQIEQIRFADGTVWDQAAVLARLETTLTGTAGDDTLYGSELADTISGLAGNDSLHGQAGNDVLDGGTGADQMFGRSGDDTFVVDDVADVVTELAGEGNDQVYTSVNFSLAGDSEIETMVLTGTDSIHVTGSSTDNTIIGNSGDNTLDGGLGSDQLQGGAGHDTYVVDHAGDSVIENADEGVDTVQSSTTYSLGANVEHLVLTGDAAIHGTGNALDNMLAGNSAANILSGGAGNDTYVVGAGDVVVESAGEGTDLVQSAVSFVLSDNVEHLTLTGAGAVNGTGNGLNNVLLGNVAANVLDGAAGPDHMTGGQGDDTYLVEDAGDVVIENADEGIDTVQASISYALGTNVENLTLTGSAALNGTGNTLDNILTGNSAANVLAGEAGHDMYVIGAGDTVVEAANSGTDTVQSALTYTLGANVENLTLTGTAAVNGTGNSLHNILVGNSAANVLTGGAGNDTYVVGAGDTVVESGGGVDVVQSSVTWTLGSNLENLTLTGTAAINGTGNGLANLLTGNSANNVLNASGGSDTLRGGAGNDTVNGGSGNDTYLFGRGEGQDLVQDSSGSADKIQYDSGINPLDLVISRQANNLRLSIHGSTDYVTIQNWYTSSSNRTETIQAGNGQTLLSTQVDQLIQAMASFSQQTGLTWDQAIDQQPTQVQAVLAASWN
jgi:Ca2+-binding RTX toxin-like protein